MTVPGVSPGQSRVGYVVDLCLFLTWTFLLGPMVVLLALPWRRLLSIERALLLLGVGLVMALLTVAFERYRKSMDTKRRFLDLATTAHEQALIDALEPYAPLSPEQWRTLEQICR